VWERRERPPSGLVFGKVISTIISFSPSSSWPTSEVSSLLSSSSRSLATDVVVNLALSRSIRVCATMPVPVKLLQESLGHIITVELKTGQTYRGKLADGTPHLCLVSIYSTIRPLTCLRSLVLSLLSLNASLDSYASPLYRQRRLLPCATQHLAEDSLNIALRDVTVTQRDGRVSQLDQVYIRGSMARFFIVPDMLANAPM
jgi:small nuclear ribonucleoprotein (snRNP)-like protein